MLEQCCNLSKRCRNNVATLCCAKRRRCKSSLVTSPLALHDFIFCLSKLYILSTASLLALDSLTKSTYSETSIKRTPSGPSQVFA